MIISCLLIRIPVTEICLCFSWAYLAGQRSNWTFIFFHLKSKIATGYRILCTRDSSILSTLIVFRMWNGKERDLCLRSSYIVDPCVVPGCCTSLFVSRYTCFTDWCAWFESSRTSSRIAEVGRFIYFLIHWRSLKLRVPITPPFSPSHPLQFHPIPSTVFPLVNGCGLSSGEFLYIANAQWYNLRILMQEFAFK